MDFNNGLYVFNGVPGLEASKGERIAKALQKLQTKIKCLEQVRISEKDESSKSGTDIEDITLSDGRLKLLTIQIQYLRLMLRKSRNERTESSVESEHQYQQLETEYLDPRNCCKETQTGMSLSEIISTKMPQLSTREEDTHTSSSSKLNAPVTETPTSNFDAVNDHYPSPSAPTFDAINSDNQLPSASAQPSSKNIPLHYRFNFDDFPFILGGSAFESHNLIANIQNLVAKMKTHSKSLCGPRFQPTQNHANSSVEKYSQETKSSQQKIMKEISNSFTNIQLSQSQMIETLDNQNNSNCVGNQVKHNPHYEKELNQKQAKKPTNTGSTITNTTTSVRLKEKQRKSTKAIKKNNHVVPTNKIRMNLPQVARQRLLRSIREVKTQLSEEDISWV